MNSGKFQRAMPAKKVLEIIKEMGHITVKSGNQPLYARLMAMWKRGEVRMATRRGPYTYYTLPDSEWIFPGSDDPND